MPCSDFISLVTCFGRRIVNGFTATPGSLVGQELAALFITPCCWERVGVSGMKPKCCFNICLTRVALLILHVDIEQNRTTTILYCAPPATPSLQLEKGLSQHYR